MARRRKKSPVELLREFACEVRRGMTAAAFVLWCEVLRQEFGCLKSERAKVEALDEVGELLADYLAGLPDEVGLRESIGGRIDGLARRLEQLS